MNLFLCIFITAAIVNANTALNNVVQDTFELENSIVKSNETNSLDKIQAASITITSDEWNNKFVNLAEVLEHQAGIQSRKTGGIGSFQSISIRGITGSHIRVFIDGIPLNDAENNSINLSTIDLHQYEKIEIYKSFAPAKFGGNSAGGVINLISKKQFKNSAELSALYGSHNTGNYSMLGTFYLNPQLKWSSRISIQHSDNNFEYFNRNGTPYNDEDDFTAKRTNSEYFQINGSHILQLNAKKGIPGTWNFVFKHFGENGGYPGTENQITQVANFKRKYAITNILWQSLELAKNKLLIDAEVLEMADQNSFFWNYNLDGIGFSDTENHEIGSLLFKTLAKLGWQFIPNDNFSIEHHLTANQENIYPKTYRGIELEEKWELRRRDISNAFESKFNFAQYFTIAGIYQNSFLIDEATNADAIKLSHGNNDSVPNISKDFHQSARATFKIDAFKKRFALWTSLGNFYQAPGVQQKFGTSNTILPNPELLSETGYNFELGTSLNIFKSNFEIVLFNTNTRNGIHYVVSQGMSKPINLGKSNIKGIETNFNTNPFKWILIGFNYTYQNPVNLAEINNYYKNMIPNEPKHSLSSQTKLGPWLGFSIAYQTEFNTTLYHDLANSLKIPKQFQHHAQLEWAFKNILSFNFSAKNLSGVEYQNIYSAYPTSGRQYFFGMKWNI